MTDKLKKLLLMKLEGKSMSHYTCYVCKRAYAIAGVRWSNRIGCPPCLAKAEPDLSWEGAPLSVIVWAYTDEVTHVTK